MAWKVCRNCGGSGRVADPKKNGGTIACPACGGRGGFDTKTV